MHPSIWQEAHRKTLTDEHQISQKDWTTIYQVEFSNPKVFGSENYPIKLTLELNDVREKKVSNNTGNEYQIAGKATISVFNSLQETMLFWWTGKSWKNYANWSFWEDHEKRLQTSEDGKEREVMPITLTILEDRPWHTFAEIKKAKIAWKELTKGKSTWKLILTEIWTADEISTDVENDPNFWEETPAVKQPEETSEVDRDALDK